MDVDRWRYYLVPLLGAAAVAVALKFRLPAAACIPLLLPVWIAATWPAQGEARSRYYLRRTLNPRETPAAAVAFSAIVVLAVAAMTVSLPVRWAIAATVVVSWLMALFAWAMIRKLRGK